MVRKQFLISDKYLVSYGSKKCIVQCPSCGINRSVSTNDYYKKRKNGLVNCRSCNKPQRKEKLQNDPQIIKYPKSFSRGAKLNLIALCGDCKKERIISVTRYCKIKQRDRIWTCYQCRKPSIIINTKNNPVYSDPKYTEQFRNLHQNKNYALKIHNDSVFQKISNTAKKNWKDDNKRRRYIAHCKTDKFKLKISQWSKQRWALIKNKVKHKNAENFVNKASNKYNNQYTYNTNEYTTTTASIDIICNVCGHQFKRVPIAHLRSCRCPSCGMSRGQHSIYDFVSSLTKCISNDRTILNKKELDIYAPSSKLAIEYHGLFWHSHNTNETTQQRCRHQQKWIEATAHGLILLQIFEHEWDKKRQIIKSIIQNKLGLSVKLDARKLNIIDISHKQSQKFFTNNHLYGARPAQFTIALVDDNTICAALSFNIKNDNAEIIRYATKQNHIIRGGLSRLLKKLVGSHKLKIIKTFADLRYGSGRGYEQVGFDLSYITKPGYFYYKNDKILSRITCQKHKLHKLLNSFEQSKSEAENMFNNGYRRFWDAGNAKYEMHLT